MTSATLTPYRDQRPTTADLTTEELWRLLHEGHEGRLHHQTGAGPRHAVLPYAVAADGIWLRVPDFAVAAHSSVGTEVTFEVSEIGADGAGWVVLVTGTATRAVGCQHPDTELTLPADLWSRWILVPAMTVSGHQVALPHTGEHPGGLA